MKKSSPKTKPGAVIIEGHVQGLANTRSLGEAGIPVIVVDTTKCIASYSKYCNKYFRCPDFQTDDFADFLIILARKEDIRGWVLIPSNDHAVYIISKHRERLQKYYKVITPHLDIIEKIYDKSKLFNIAEKLNIPIPVTQDIKSVYESINGKISYPAITKGRYGLSFYRAIGKKVLVANNENELHHHLQLIDDKIGIDNSITQEIIPYTDDNHTVSYTAFCENGEIKTYWMGEKLREHPLRFGTATYAKSVYIDECHQLSIPLLKALNYTGVCEVEYLYDQRDGKYKFIEINARTWLWVGLAKACGVDYAKIIYDYVNDIALSYPSDYDINKFWINPVSDIAYSFIGIIKRDIHPGNYIYSLFNGKNINALLAKGDVKPGIVYMLSLYAYLKQR
jgi:D-aspartate ligase